MNRYLMTISGTIHRDLYKEFIGRVNRYRINKRMVECIESDWWPIEVSFYINEDAAEMWEAQSLGPLFLEKGEIEVTDLALRSWCEQGFCGSPAFRTITLLLPLGWG